MTETITTRETCTFTVPAHELYRILHNASLAADRTKLLPALHAVRIEIEDGSVRAIGTDRYRLFIDTTKLDVREGQPADATFLLDLTDATALVKLLKSEKQLSVAVTIADAMLHVSAGSTSVRYVAVDGDFPRYRTLVPSGEPGTLDEPFAFNPQLLVALSKVVVFEYSGKAKPPNTVKIVMTSAAAKPARIEIGETFHGCIMPVRLPK